MPGLLRAIRPHSVSLSQAAQGLTVSSTPFQIQIDAYAFNHISRPLLANIILFRTITKQIWACSIDAVTPHHWESFLFMLAFDKAKE